MRRWRALWRRRCNKRAFQCRKTVPSVPGGSASGCRRTGLYSPGFLPAPKASADRPPGARRNPDSVRTDTAAACRAGDHDADRWHRSVCHSKPDARLVKLLIRACQFNAALLDSDGVPFAALAKRHEVSPFYFTRLVRLSYLAPDITDAILDGRQPRDLTADKLLAHSRLPLTWHEQRTVLGFT